MSDHDKKDQKTRKKTLHAITIDIPAGVDPDSLTFAELIVLIHGDAKDFERVRHANGLMNAASIFEFVHVTDLDVMVFNLFSDKSGILMHIQTDKNNADTKTCTYRAFMSKPDSEGKDAPKTH